VEKRAGYERAVLLAATPNARQHSRVSCQAQVAHFLVCLSLDGLLNLEEITTRHGRKTRSAKTKRFVSCSHAESNSGRVGSSN
jgi:hypothetical protein